MCLECFRFKFHDFLVFSVFRKPCTSTQHKQHYILPADTTWSTETAYTCKTETREEKDKNQVHQQTGEPQPDTISRPVQSLMILHAHSTVEAKAWTVFLRQENYTKYTQQNM